MSFADVPRLLFCIVVQPYASDVFECKLFVAINFEKTPFFSKVNQDLTELHSENIRWKSMLHAAYVHCWWFRSDGKTRTRWSSSYVYLIYVFYCRKWTQLTMVIQTNSPVNRLPSAVLVGVKKKSSLSCPQNKLLSPAQFSSWMIQPYGAIYMNQSSQEVV